MDENDKSKSDKNREINDNIDDCTTLNQMEEIVFKPKKKEEMEIMKKKEKEAMKTLIYLMMLKRKN